MATPKDEPKDEAGKSGPKMVTAAVAPRHTVIAGIASSGGAPGVRKRHMPGELIELPEEEAFRLIKTGVLLAPNAPQQVIATGNGPAFDSTKPAVIKPE